MTNETLTINIFKDKKLNLNLHTIQINDLKNLIKWKNANRNAFFDQTKITYSMQLVWFNSYKLRKNDYMFICSLDNINFGCMGIRYLNNYGWDIYNVILGLDKFKKKGLMTLCINSMISYALNKINSNISLKVLNNNPAILWYQKLGFNNSKIHKNYTFMILSDDYIKKLKN